VLLSVAYPADRTRMNNKIYFQLLYITPAAVPGWTFFKCPAERKASNVACYFTGHHYNMNPHEFEIAVETDFLNQGFEINHVGKSYDKGVDFIAFDNEMRIAVQVKMYESRVVRYQEFMYLFAGQKLYDCDKSVLITTNKIDSEAKKVAEKLGVDYYEKYVSSFKVENLKTNGEKLISKTTTDFYDIWQKHIKPLKGQTIHTATGKENYISNVTNDYVYRKSSTGGDSKIEYKIFETIYHRLLEVKSITRDEINTEYTKRASAIITVILSCIPNIELIQKPKIALRLK